jgi:hypothetical protein
VNNAVAIARAGHQNLQPHVVENGVAGSRPKLSIQTWFGLSEFRQRLLRRGKDIGPLGLNRIALRRHTAAKGKWHKDGNYAGQRYLQKFGFH